jgi:GTP:adenosylcobinamide-phosphate guanylyltransferase
MLDAVVLAGGKENKLKQYGENKALIKIKTKLMIEYVIDALFEVDEINRIVVVGPKDKLATTLKTKVYKIVEASDSILQNLIKGIEAIEGTDKILVVSSDIPMVTPKAIKDFLELTRHKDADLYYPIISKEDNDKKFPGVKRTYVKLKDGTFTGGNLFLLKPRIIQKCLIQAEKILANRKKPWRIAKILGWMFVIKLLLGTLDIAQLEKRASKVLGIKVLGIKSSYPEIGTDVDKPSDIEIVKRYMAGKSIEG